MFLLNRREDLDKIFKEVDPNEKELVNPLLDEIVFLENQMKYLKTLPFIRVHPIDTSRQETTPAAKQYKECSQSYMNAIRILCAILHKVDSSAEEDLLKKLEEFK